LQIVKNASSAADEVINCPASAFATWTWKKVSSSFPNFPQNRGKSNKISITGFIDDCKELNISIEFVESAKTKQKDTNTLTGEETIKILQEIDPCRFLEKTRANSIKEVWNVFLQGVKMVYESDNEKIDPVAISELIFTLYSL